MNERRVNLVAVGAMAVAFVVVLSALVVLARGDDSIAEVDAGTQSTLTDPGGDVVLRGGEAVATFLAEFERSTDSTFKIVAELTREVDTGASITNRFEVVQRPPRQFIRSISGTEQGAIVSDAQFDEVTTLVSGVDSMYTVVVIPAAVTPTQTPLPPTGLQAE